MTDRAIVAVFSNQNAAYDAADAVKDLAKGKVGFKVKAGVLVAKDANGNARLLDEKSRGLWGTAWGGVIGAIIGAIGGLAGAAAGAALGGLGGMAAIDATGDLIDQDTIDSIVQDIRPNMTALILEVDEESTTPVDAIVAANDGVLRRVDL